MDFDNQLRPMEFGEIFGAGWRLTRGTAKTAGLLMLIAIIPLFVTLGLMMHGIMGGVADIVLDPAMRVKNPDGALVMQHMLPLMGSLAAIIPLQIITALLLPFAHTATILAGWEQLNDRELTFGDMIRRTFGRAFWYVLAQSILIVGIVMLANFALIFLGAIVGLVTMGIGAIVVNFAYQVAVIYFVIATIFRMHHIVVEDRGPWHGLTESIALVKNNWWKVFGVLFVLGVACSLVLIPLFIPAISSLVSFISTHANHTPGAEPRPEDVAMILNQIGDMFSPLLFGALGIVYTVFALMVTHSTTALYGDLRARRGDFATGDDDDDLRVAVHI